MPIHQLELSKRSKDETDDERVVGILRNRITLREALRIDDKLLAAYRRQAEVLFASQKWQSAADVVQGLIALDAAGSRELLILIRAFEELGEHEKAASISAAMSGVLAEI